jgi:hypothetical protein
MLVQNVVASTTHADGTRDRTPRAAEPLVSASANEPRSVVATGEKPVV